ncbi:hypothetical protein HOLleu_23814 [Holothuria leucospilota]|uniref:Integrase catalytic domain-containing protein n=1 Tax=Holothuria leucospilota TaxID=206669 RepID=A0A9Q1H5X2_HOLLE|nr:hypothetical protein HOLleu_23814 [Holothuria leucospilota]
MEEAKKKRSVLKGALTRIVKALHTAIQEGCPVEYVNVLYNDMIEGWKKVQSAHEAVLMLGDPEDVEQEQWITELEDRYNKARLEVIKYRANKVTAETDRPSRKSEASLPPIQLKKMDMPRFEGDLRKYARFKEDFNKFVIPVTNTDQVTFALRQALGPEPRKILGPIEDDVSKMWERLDEKYDDKIKLVDIIVNDIEKKREVKDGESRKLVAYIDDIEAGYNDLKKAGLEKEMSNSRVVGEIERKLPPSVFGRWVRYMHDDRNNVDKTDRLPELLKFLFKERRSLEYSMEGIRNSQTSKAVMHAVDVEVPRVQASCVIHRKSQHTTDSCRTYLAKAPEERMKVIRENKACFCCLGIGHIVARCNRKKQCGVQGCTRLHHNSLHRQGTSGTGDTSQIGNSSGEQGTTASVFSVQNGMQTSADPCLLQLMEVKSRHGSLVTLWDSCATASLITFAAAGKIKAKGSPVRIQMTKVGGTTETVDSLKYRVPLIDKEGNTVNIEAYGIECLTAKVANKDLTHLAKLFRGVSAEEVSRPSGEVDLLVGFEYAGYHPVKAQACGHLVLLENQFGRCIGGSHPSLELEQTMGLHIHHIRTTKFDEFLSIESMGISCVPGCGGCKCGKCPVGARNLTLQEERELHQIENNMTRTEGRWVAKYPWIKDPKDLPDNRQDQHCHRFLWRGMNSAIPPKTYCVTAVNFGDRPSATIATVALRKTAEAEKTQFPEAAETILTNVYMDDILECVSSDNEAVQRAGEIEQLLEHGNFSIKRWTFSGNGSNEDSWIPKSEKVLGISWKPVEDILSFKDNVKTFKEVPEILTKRICLSKISSVYDSLGLLTPVTVRAKILLRKLWGAKLEWDEPISDTARSGWVELFEDLSNSSQLEFKRCVKPRDAEPGVLPTLVMFSDASQQALGTAAYIRYKLLNGHFESRLIASKSRVAPIEIISIVRLELSAAVMSKRLASYILKEMRIDFGKVFYIVDSEIVRAMIQKESYGYKAFAATRIGEIRQETEPNDWWWCKGELNVADFITRGRTSQEIGTNSTWQDGPGFLALPVDQWPVGQSCYERTLPERVKVVMVEDVEEIDSLASRINLRKYSSYDKLLRVTARVLSLYRKKKLSGAVSDPTAEDIRMAEMFWVREAQRPMLRLFEEDKRQFYTLYARLGPRLREDGIIVVGARIKEHVHFSYNNEEVALLPQNHPFSRLYSTSVHNRGHLGIQSTVSKVRSRYWIIGVQRMVKGIKYRCITCRQFEKRLAGQQMGPLPMQRLKPSPPWMYVGVDLFGPFTTRGEVNKRARGKAYGVIFNCLVTRAVYLDVAADYGTDAFLQVMRRFVTIRGYPKEVYSDSGTQLIAAATQLQGFGVESGLTWKFSTPDAPWQNGATESLIRGVKKALQHSIGDQVLMYSELQTVMYEVANLINERPIGRHPTEPEDGSYLCPNDLLLGRSSSRVPDGPCSDNVNPKQRLQFIQSLVNGFWRKWTRDFFPSLIVRQKWHTVRRNLQKEDVVLVQDSNIVRGKWRMGIVTEVYPDKAGNVRNVKVKVCNDSGGQSSIKRDAQRAGYRNLYPALWFFLSCFILSMVLDKSSSKFARLADVYYSLPISAALVIPTSANLSIGVCT